MNELNNAYWFLNPMVIGAIIIREMIWKGIALWKAGNRKQKRWFIFLFIFNTVGILPIIYLVLNKKNHK